MQTALTRSLSGLPGRGNDLKLGYRIQLAWPKIVGEMMARFMFPVDVHGDRLSIGVTSSVWMQEAEYQRDTLLANIAAELGSKAIRHLAFKMLPQAPGKPALAGANPAPQAAPEPPRALTESEEAHLASELERIADPGLREQMRRVLAKSLQRYQKP
jgi:hypothetical protein